MTPPTLATLRARRATMLDYLRLRVAMQDWHGCRDAAADLEVLDAQIRTVEAMTPTIVVDGGATGAWDYRAMRDLVRSAQTKTKRRARKGT